MAKKTFEESLTRLESIVKQLEEGKLSLDDSLKLFEEGVSLSQFCSEKLDEAEGKIEVILKRGTKETIQPFSPEESDPPNGPF